MATLKIVHQTEIRFYNNGELCQSYAKFTDLEMGKLDIIIFYNETVDLHKELKGLDFRIYQSNFHTTNKWEIINK